MKSKTRNLLIGVALLAAVITLLVLTSQANLLKTQIVPSADTLIYIPPGADGTGSWVPATDIQTPLTVPYYVEAPTPTPTPKPVGDRPLAANEMCRCGCLEQVAGRITTTKLCDFHQADYKWYRMYWPLGVPRPSWVGEPSGCLDYDDHIVLARTVDMCLRYSDPSRGVRERTSCGGYAFRPNSTYFSVEGKFTNCRVVPK